MALYLRRSERAQTQSVPFAYRWTHVPTKKWYVGSRTAPGCNINDGYVCSSKLVKEMITTSPNEWTREILFLGTIEEVMQFEVNYLKAEDAKNNTLSFNRHNGDGKFTSTGKIVATSTKQKMSLTRKGVNKSKAHAFAISNALKKSNKIKTRKGLTASRFVGMYIAPNGQCFSSSHDAATTFNLSAPTIRVWANKNKNGWIFQPKEVM